MSAWHGLFAILAVWSGLATQSPRTDLPPSWLVRANEVVAGERARMALEAWERARPADRDAAVAALVRNTLGGSPTWAPPTPQAWTAAWRAATGSSSESDQVARLRELADSIDLRVVPGFFASRSEGAGEPMTVRVRSLWTVESAPDVKLRLLWRREGRADGIARSEPIAASAFAGPGFDVYLRPPVSDPGDWTLVPEVEAAERVERGIGVVVECAADSRSWVECARGAAADRASISAVQRVLARDLLAAHAFGLRVPEGLSVPECGALVCGKAAQPGVHPLELVFTDRAGREHFLWSAGEVAAARAACLLLVARHESPEAVLTGSIGARWRDWARAKDIALFAAHLPVEMRDGSAPRAVLARVRSLTRSATRPVRLGLVARPATLPDLQASFDPSEALPYDVLLASTSLRSPNPGSASSVPALYVVRTGGAQPSDSLRGVSWVGGPSHPMFDEPGLLRWADTWFAPRLLDRTEGAASPHSR